MESRFGSDFSGVRIHDNSHAATLNRELNAQAFTRGTDIFFNKGYYNPETSSGKHLLAHELTHVVQQNPGTRMTTAPGLSKNMLARKSPVLQANNSSISIDHNVNLVPQPTRVSCWAAALTMVVSYRDSASYSPATIASQAGMNLNAGYGWPRIRRAVSTWGLSQTAPMSAYPSYWADLLRTYGPLWIVKVGAPYHAVVLGGMHGTGSPDATEVTIYNPWRPNVGAIQYRTFRDFDNGFGLGAGAGAAIVHA